MMSATSLPRRIAAALLVACAAAASLLLATPAHAADSGGYIRLAHLVPDKILCDMYIQLNSVKGDVVKKLPGIGYGTISDYQSVPSGTYAISMRKPGDPATAAPVLSASVTVADGRAYTVARIGAPGKAEARAIEDDRSLPEGGKAKIRVLQAAQRTVDVSVKDGGNVAKGVAFATATGYQGLDTGNRTVTVQPAGGKATTVKADVTAGSVYSLLVLEGTDGGVTAALRTDAKRAGTVPRGGVEAGGGGTSTSNSDTVTVVAGVLMLLALAGLGLRARRR
jgi:MYXO-CTERM domain-containing protein